VVRSLAILMLAAAVVTGCGRGTDSAGDARGAGSSNLSGTIEADGSSTVGPFTTAAAEAFRERNPNVQVTVGVSGTGGGFERFCANETDLSNASRPIKDEEAAACDQAGVEYVEFHVANDALTVVVNPENDWVTCLTTDDLKRIWDRGSKVKSWRDVNSRFPDVRLRLFGPGTDSGTFDYFTDEITGEEGRSRSDYAATEDDNVIVQGVAGERGALGYFGLSYFEQNSQQLNAVEIDGGDGCVAPSVATAQSGEYTPLARPLFVYAKKSALERREVREFVEYMLENESEIAERANFVPLTDEQLRDAKDALAES
jgi:phosphate transport system substrate-binding protein